jgi:hypothetical protein
MGLDTYAARTPHPFGLTDDDIAAIDAAAPNLHGGWENRHDGSLFSEDYLGLVRQVSGVDLDQEWIPNEVVRQVAAALDDLGLDASADPYEMIEQYPGAPMRYQALELRGYFRVCADRGLSLVGHHDDEAPKFVNVAARVRHPHGLTDEEVEALDAAAPGLCGSMYSGGDGSFRGKVYVELVQEITGTSLYDNWIPPGTVREMAAAFGPGDHPSAEHSDEEVRQLAAFFRVCGDRGLGLVGWW